MNPIVGWGLAAVAVAVGGLAYGWQGVVMAATLVVFWLLLQFSRLLRTMKDAGRAPVGHVPSAVMLHAKLRRGMTLMQVIALTRSLGRRVGEASDAWAWADDGQAEVTLAFDEGRLAHWSLQRPPEPVHPPSP